MGKICVFDNKKLPKIKKKNYKDTGTRKPTIHSIFHFLKNESSFKKKVLIDPREKKREREKHHLAASCMCPDLVSNTTRVRALTGDRTRHLLMHGMALQPAKPHQPEHVKAPFKFSCLN